MRSVALYASLGIVVSLCATAPGCSDDASDGNPPATGHSGGSTGSGAGGTGGTSSGAGGGAGEGWASGGTGSDQKCTSSGTTLDWSYTAPDGTTYDEDTLAEDGGFDDLVHLDASGTVVDSSDDSIAIDVCAPNDECEPEVHAFTATGGQLDVPTGTFVRLQAVISPAGYPTPELSLLGLVLTNLESFGDEDNPTETGERLWFALSTGLDLFSPVEWGKTENVCTQTNPFFRAMWDLRIGVAGESVVVSEGMTELLTVSGGPQQGTYGVTNLNSHADVIEGPSTSTFRVERD